MAAFPISELAIIAVFLAVIGGLTIAHIPVRRLTGRWHKRSHPAGERRA